MNKERTEELLQQCLAAYDTGVTPEECLSSYPDQREALEPLFRQALALRIAYARTPSEEFKQATREKLLFAAGRDVSRALASQPREEFISTARERLLATAGAQARESLRNIPPPRLPFWVNARRRLLEAAALAGPRPLVRPMTFALRTSLSAAVVVLALGIAALALLTSQNQTSVSADFAALEQEWQAIEQQYAAGQPVSPTVLVELTRKANDLAEKLNDQPAAPVTGQLQEIIERQKEVVTSAASENPSTPELRQAQQQLAQAEETVRLLAARVETPTAVVSIGTVPSATPEATKAPATPTATAVPPKAGEVRVGLLSSDTTFGLNWVQIQTMDLKFVVPSSWTIVGLTVNSSGIAVLENNFLRIDGPDVIVQVDTGQAEFTALVAGQALSLRDENGKLISADELVAKAGPLAPQLYHLVESIETNPKATPVPTPTSTSR